MRRPLRAYLGLLAALPLLAVVPLVLHAEWTAPMLTKPARVRCYCNCEPKDGSRQCGMMCDLPKYQNRDWAVSCRKRPAVTPRQSPESQPHSAPRNRPEFARR
jgi:hypothetical protein